MTAARDDIDFPCPWCGEDCRVSERVVDGEIVGAVGHVSPICEAFDSMTPMEFMRMGYKRTAARGASS